MLPWYFPSIWSLLFAIGNVHIFDKRRCHIKSVADCFLCQLLSIHRMRPLLFLSSLRLNLTLVTQVPSADINTTWVISLCDRWFDSIWMNHAPCRWKTILMSAVDVWLSSVWDALGSRVIVKKMSRRGSEGMCGRKPAISSRRATEARRGNGVQIGKQISFTCLVILIIYASGAV